MAFVVNTSVPSIHAARTLSRVQQSVDGALQRLASGLRINSAKDDAAGLAISNKITTRIRGLTVAARNVNDGVSLMQSAEAAMGSVVDALQRMRDLAVQSLNAGNTASDRGALDTEFQQLKAEVDRVARTASFNSTKLLDGSVTQVNFQVGADGDDAISVTALTSLRTTALGEGGFEAAQAGSLLTSAAGITAAGEFTFMVNGVTYDVYQGTPIDGDAQSLANAVNAAAVPGVTATAARTTVTGNFSGGSVSAGQATLTLNGTNITLNLTGSGIVDVASTIAAIQAKAATTGVSAAHSGSGITLTAIDGHNIALSFSGGATGANADNVGLGDGAGSVVAPLSFGSYDIAYSGAKAIPGLTIGGSAGAEVKGQADNLLLPVRSGTQLAQVDLTSQGNAKTALRSIDNSLETVNSARAGLGGFQGRFDSAFAAIQTEIGSLSAARSRILDADFAVETAELARAGILRQAASAMLVQANAQPQSVLSLLL